MCRNALPCIVACKTPQRIQTKLLGQTSSVSSTRKRHPSRSKRRLEVVATELFRCELLDCKLSYRSCSMRHVKGESLARGTENAWVPEQWALYAFQCRGCSIGALHAAALGSVAPKKPGPNKPPPPTPMGNRNGSDAPGRKPLRWCKDRECGQPFAGAGNYCAGCRKRIRAKVLAR